MAHEAALERTSSGRVRAELSRTQRSELAVRRYNPTLRSRPSRNGGTMAPLPPARALTPDNHCVRDTEQVFREQGLTVTNMRLDFYQADAQDMLRAGMHGILPELQHALVDVICDNRVDESAVRGNGLAVATAAPIPLHVSHTCAGLRSRCTQAAGR